MSARKITIKTPKAYKFFDAHRDELSIKMMCRLLGVARVSHYAWRGHPVSDRAHEDARLLRLISGLGGRAFSPDPSGGKFWCKRNFESIWLEGGHHE